VVHQNNLSPQPRVRMQRSIDGVSVQTKPQRPIVPQTPRPISPTPRATQTQQPKHTAIKQTVPAPETTKKTKLGNNIRYTLLLVVAMVLGVLAHFQLIGQIAIVLYMVGALVWHIASRNTFILALLALGTVPVTIALGQDRLSQNFAAYSFLLFAVGALQIVTEEYRHAKMLRKKHTT